MHMYIYIYIYGYIQRLCLTFWLHSIFCEGDPPVLHNISVCMNECTYVFIYLFRHKHIYIDIYRYIDI